MMTIVTRKVYLRPTMSPRRPKTSAPKGRTKNPAAKASSAKMKPVVSLTPEKNCREMIAESAPYRKKSYHSNRVPSEDAKMTRRCEGSKAGAGVLMTTSVAGGAGQTKKGMDRLAHPPKLKPVRATPRGVCPGGRQSASKAHSHRLSR